MSEPLPPGHFCWVDVAVGDPTASHTFFSELFGWGRRVRPTPDAQAYHIMTLQGHPVAGICGVGESGPSQWMSYLLVEDLKRATDRARALGGDIWTADVEIPTFGKMSVVEDPTGGVFALWQSERGEKPPPIGPGTFGWTELITNDVEKATAFYTQLVGWTYRDTRFGELEYRIFQKGEREVGGVKIGPSPSRWMVHFGVPDCDAAYARARDLGGETLDPPFDLEGIGRCAVVCDPSGGSFGIIQYTV